MSILKPMFIDIENDCGDFHVQNVKESDFEDYFYETYILASAAEAGSYGDGYKDGWEAAMRNVKQFTDYQKVVT